MSNIIPKKLLHKFHGCINFPLVVIPPEPGLKLANDIFIQLKGLNKNIRIDGRVGAKDCVCNGDNPWILASKGNSIGVSYVELEVNETDWKNEDISKV